MSLTLPLSRKRSSGAAFVAAAVAAALCAQPASARTLEEAVRIIVTTNPEIGAVRKNRRAIGEELRAARGLYFPQVDVRGAVGPEASLNAATRGRGKSGFDGMPRQEAGVVVQQRLFDGFFTDSEVARQKARVNSARHRVSDTAQAVALKGIEAYLDVLRTARVVALSKRNLEAHQAILRRVTARARGGRGPRSDVEQARARMYAATGNLASAQGRYEDAVARYRAVVGERPEGLAPVTAPELELPANVDAASDIAVKTAPAILAAAADINTAMGQIGVARSEFFPKISIEAAANRLRNVDGVRGSTFDGQALIVGRWSLFRGGSDSARLREAKARLSEARDTLDRARREVVQQVRTSWAALNAARGRRVALQNQVAATAKVRDAYSKQFDLGQRTLLDLLDIQNELFTTRSQLVTEDFTVKFGVYRTLATMGMLLQTMGVPAPAEATRKPNSFRRLERRWGN
jgi:adhesin transport system outer membrane protein